MVSKHSWTPAEGDTGRGWRGRSQPRRDPLQAPPTLLWAGAVCPLCQMLEAELTTHMQGGVKEAWSLLPATCISSPRSMLKALCLTLSSRPSVLFLRPQVRCLGRPDACGCQAARCTGT